MDALQNRVALTPAEAREALAVGETKWHELIKSGELPTIKIGKSRRVLVTDLQAFLATHRQSVAA